MTPPKKEKAAAAVVDPRAERLKSLNEMREKLNKEAGDRLLMTLHDEASKGIDVISTGVPSLDIGIGLGGIPRGRIVEFYGPEQSGKTTVALQVAANAQRMGMSILYIDAENALDPTYCQKLGLDVEKEDFVICQPDYGEQGLNAALRLIDAGLIDLVIIDSIPALTPHAKFDRINSESTSQKVNGVESGGNFVGLHARMMSSFLSVAVSKAKRANCTVLGLNQIRKEITPMGAREGRPGGNAWAHAASLRVNFRRIETTTEGKADTEDVTGKYGKTKAQIVKNKFAPPMQLALFDLVFGEGADFYKNLMKTCAREGLPAVYKNGAWFTFFDANGEQMAKFQGEDAATEGLKLKPELVEALVDALSVHVGIDIFDPNRPDRIPGVRDEGPSERRSELEAEAAEELEANPVEPTDDEPAMTVDL